MYHHNSTLIEQYEKIQKLAPSQEIPSRLLDLVNSSPIHTTSVDANIDDIRNTINKYISSY